MSTEQWEEQVVLERTFPLTGAGVAKLPVCVGVAEADSCRRVR